MNYIANILIQFGLYIICALSLNILIGYLGLFSLCHAALYGIGAYTASILMIKLGFHFIPAWILAILMGSLASLFISLPTKKLKGDAFTLCTLAFQVAAIGTLNNLTNITGGPYGITGIPAPSFLSISLKGAFNYSFIVIIFTLFILYIASALAKSPFGLTMLSTRSDEIASRAIGKNVFRTRIIACAIAGSCVSLGGAIYASYFSYIDPSSFSLGESFIFLTIVVMGGSGNIRGPIVGAAIMIFVPELLRLAQIPGFMAPNIRQMILGILLIVLMFLRPQGFYGRYSLR